MKKINKRARKIVFTDDIYDHSFTLFIGTNKEWADYVKKNYGIESDPDCHGESTYFENKEKGFTRFYIYLERFDWTIHDQAILMHELVHHVFKVFERTGVYVATDNNEAYAYYFEYLMRKIYNRLKPKKLKKK